MLVSVWETYSEVDDVPSLITVQKKEGGFLTGTGQETIFSEL